MKLKYCYIILTIMVFIATFSTFYLLGDTLYHSLRFGLLNMAIFIIILGYMIGSGRWKLE